MAQSYANGITLISSKSWREVNEKIILKRFQLVGLYGTEICTFKLLGYKIKQELRNIN